MINSAGRYRAKATEVDLRVSKNGNDMVIANFYIEDERCSLPWSHTFGSTKAANEAIRSLRAMGWRGTDITDLSGATDNEVELKVEMETWEGKKRAKVKYVDVPGKGIRGEPMDAARKASFAERLKGQIAMLDSGEGDSFGGDDIPF